MTGDLPNRTPGASGYQQWMAGDVYQRVVFMPGPAKYSDPDDPAVQQHVMEVLNRPHIRAIRSLHNITRKDSSHGHEDRE